jgi:hypothetical protein
MEIEKYSPKWLLKNILESGDQHGRALMFIVEFQNHLMSDGENNVLHGVVKSLPTEECVKEWYREGIDEKVFWEAKPDWTNKQIAKEINKALTYFISRWQ